MSSSGFEYTFHACPERTRLKPRMGSVTNPPASCQKRFMPVASLSRIIDEKRYSVSPTAAPPRPVEIMSLNDIGCVSPIHSHWNAPKMPIAYEGQNVSPLARAAL